MYAAATSITIDHRGAASHHRRADRRRPGLAWLFATVSEVRGSLRASEKFLLVRCPAFPDHQREIQRRTVMIKERNGVTFFESKDDYADHPAFKALSTVSLGDVRFPFGFFLVEEEGKTFVVPGTQEDHRKTLVKVFPDIDPKSFE